MSEPKESDFRTTIRVAALLCGIAGGVAGFGIGYARASAAVHSDAVRAGHGHWVPGSTGAPVFQWVPVKPEH